MRTLIFTTLYLLIIGVIFRFLHPFQQNLIQDFSRVDFLIECALFLASIYSLSYFCFSSVIPGSFNYKLNKLAFLPFLLLFLFLLTKALFIQEPISQSNFTFFCEVEIIIAALLILPHFYYILKKGFFINKVSTIFYLSLACATIPSGLMHLFCSSQAKHVLIFHFSPIFVFSILCLFFTKKTFQK